MLYRVNAIYCNPHIDIEKERRALVDYSTVVVANKTHHSRLQSSIFYFSHASDDHDATEEHKVGVKDINYLVDSFLFSMLYQTNTFML